MRGRTGVEMNFPAPLSRFIPAPSPRHLTGICRAPFPARSAAAPPSLGTAMPAPLNAARAAAAAPAASCRPRISPGRGS